MANILMEAITANIAAQMSGDQDVTREAVEEWVKDRRDARQERKLRSVTLIREEFTAAKEAGDIDKMFTDAYGKILKNIVGS